jgi:hypothetical protein
LGLRISGRTRARDLLRAFLLATVVNCGPPLTDPASTSAAGRWHSSNRVGPLSEITLDLAQQSDGVVNGQWSAILLVPNPACPPGLGAGATNGGITGTNTVLEIRLDLNGIGEFEGQLYGAELRGSILSCSSVTPITFSLVGSVPGG